MNLNAREDQRRSWEDHAYRRAERPYHQSRARNAHGRADAALLAPDRRRRRARQEPHESGAAPRRGPRPLPQSKRDDWPDRGVVRPPPGQPAVRHTGGRGAPVPLPWLALRRDRPVHRDPGRGGGLDLRNPGQAQGLSRRRAGRTHLRVHGPGAPAPAAPLLPLRRAGNDPQHRVGGRAVQLAPGHGELVGPHARRVPAPLLLELRARTARHPARQGQRMGNPKVRGQS